MAGPGGIEAGRAAVVVLPDLSKFARSLQKYLSRIERSVRLQVATETNTAGLEEDLDKVRKRQRREPVQVPVSPADDDFTRRVRATAQKVSRSIEATIPLTVEGEQFRATLAAATAGLEQTLSLQIPVEPAAAAAFRAGVAAQLAQVQALADRVPVEVQVQPDPDPVGFAARLATFVREAQAAAPPVKLRTELDRDQVGAMSTLTTVTGQLSVTAASVGAALVQWGPPIVAALAAAVAMAPAVAAVVPAVGAATAATGALVVGFQGVGTALSNAFDPTKAAEYQAALRDLTPAAADAVQSIVALAPAFTRVREAVQQTLFAGVGPLIDTVGPGLAGALQTGLTPMAAGLNAAGKQLGTFLTAGGGLKLLSTFLTQSTTAVQPLLTALTPLSKAFLQIGIAAAPALQSMSNAILRASQRFADFIDRASKSGDLTKTISGAARSAGQLLSGFAAVLGPLARGLALIGPPVISGISAGLQAMGSVLSSVSTSTGPLAGALSAVSTLIAPLVAGFQGFATAVGPQVQPTIDALRNSLSVLLPTLQGIAQQFMAVLGPGIQQIGQIIGGQLLPAFQAVLPVVTRVANVLLKFFGAALVGVLKGALNIVKGALTAISGVLNVFAGIFTGNWSRVWTGVKQILSGVLKVIIGAVQVFFNGGVLRLFGAGLRAVVGLVKGAGPLLSSAGSAIIGLLRSGISLGWRAVMAMVRGYPKLLTSLWDKAGDLLLQVGRNIINGLINGMSKAKDALLNAARGMATSVVDAIKSTLKIFSPSKVMVALGRWVTRGFSDGILKDASSVRDAGDQLATKVRDAFAQFQGRSGAIAERIAKDKIAVDRARDAYAAALTKHGKSAAAAAASARQRLGDAVAKLAGDKQDLAALRKSYGALSNLTSDQVNKLVRGLSQQNARLAKAVAARERIAAGLNAARDRLQEAMRLRDDYAKSVADAARQFGTVVLASEGKAITSADVVASLQAKLIALNRFRANLDALRARGLSDVALRQLVDAGVEAGSATAAALAAGGTQAVAEVNSLTSAIGAQADLMGSRAADQFYGAGVAAAQGLVTGLQSQLGALTQVAERMADTLVKTIRTKLKIKSPSRVTHGLGLDTGAGYAGGLDASRRLVASATDRMISIPSGVKIPAQRQGLAAGGATVAVTVHNPVPETASESTTRIMRRLSVLAPAA